MEIADRAVSVVFDRIENKKEDHGGGESSFLPNKMKAGLGNTRGTMVTIIQAKH